MTFAFVLLAAGFFAGGLATPVLHVPRGEVQLFVDDGCIANSRGLQRTLRQPRKDDGGNAPVIPTPAALGPAGTLEANGSIVYDLRQRRWVMYATAVARMARLKPDTAWQFAGLVRYVSADGLSWKCDSPDGLDRVFPLARGDLYDQAAKSSDDNYFAGATVVYDGRDGQWPYRAWFWIHRKAPGVSGAHYYHSADGRHFVHVRQVLFFGQGHIRQEGLSLMGPSDTSRFAYDPVGERFLAEIKYYSKKPDPITGNAYRSRVYAFVKDIGAPLDCRQFEKVTLLPSGRQEHGDFPPDEYYDTTAYRYGSGWLGELKVWHGAGNYPWSAAGCAYLKFISSRDGITWHKVPYLNDAGIPEVFIANGPEGGNGDRDDGGYITPFGNPPIRLGDKLIYYYGSSSTGKNQPEERHVIGGGIFRARLRPDGFVSVDGGELTTPPLDFGGGRLAVNSRGSVKVEALDPEGRVLGAALLYGDGLRQPALFAGRSLRELRGSRATLALRFTVKPGASLYAFVID